MTALIFDKARLRQLRNAAAAQFNDTDFLIKATARSIIDRLSIITPEFKTVAIYGARLNEDDLTAIISALGAETVFLLDVSEDMLARHAENAHIHLVQSDSEWLPFAHQTLDAVIAVFEHHSLNDLPGALIQARRALRPDGLFMAALPGGDTLYELREAMTKAEIQLYDGLSPHIFPFADKQQYGALKQRAGFALPVVDSEYYKVSYTSIYKLFADIKSMGEGNSLNARNKAALMRPFFDLSEALYRTENGFADDKRFDVTFEIIHIIGWAPHKNQQQPLKPGSADHRLADILS
jgi:NADH dehydrogenase [ubiquinone] 1 alpha subcomplex assembly factor 5